MQSSDRLTLPAACRLPGEASTHLTSAQRGRMVHPLNQLFAVLFVEKKCSSMLPTFWAPALVGCVPSRWKSLQAQVRPSRRGIRPSAQVYGPHPIHGRKRGWCAILLAIVHLTEKPLSYAYGSGLIFETA